MEMNAAEPVVDNFFPSLSSRGSAAQSAHKTASYAGYYEATCWERDKFLNVDRQVFTLEQFNYTPTHDVSSNVPLRFSDIMFAPTSLTYRMTAHFLVNTSRSGIIRQCSLQSLTHVSCVHVFTVNNRFFPVRVCLSMKYNSQVDNP